MRTLDEIALTTGAGTDKDSAHHGYTRHCDPLFSAWRDEPIRLLEIGVERGHSVRIWLEYFTQARIYGVDIQEAPPVSDPRFTFVRGDQSDPAFWDRFLEENGGNFSVIIDDGSHKSDGIIPSFLYLWPQVISGGLYLIEDLLCSYWSDYQVAGWPNQMDFIKSLLDDINRQTDYVSPAREPLKFPLGANGSRGIDWLRFSEELAIIKKK